MKLLDSLRSWPARHRAVVVVRKAAARSHSGSDRIAYALDARLVTHPELIPSESGDPAWDAWLTARAAEMDAAWTAAHTKTAGGQS